MSWDHRYRRLNEGETIMAGDEVQVDKPFGWKPASCIGEKAPSPLYTSHRVYRRRIDPDHFAAVRTQDPRGCDSGGKKEPAGDEDWFFEDGY